MPAATATAAASRPIDQCLPTPENKLNNWKEPVNDNPRSTLCTREAGVRTPLPPKGPPERRRAIASHREATAEESEAEMAHSPKISTAASTSIEASKGGAAAEIEAKRNGVGTGTRGKLEARKEEQKERTFTIAAKRRLVKQRKAKSVDAILGEGRKSKL
eukprot:GHVT01078432.1.p3 GENE.GHVT01078432.1~~GHVT01078432.1.p3  ORF type:complete len:160 (-),score=30.67 GHVT01078432.1:466-945(-)